MAPRCGSCGHLHQRGDQPSAGGHPPSYAVSPVVDNLAFVTSARGRGAYLIDKMGDAGPGNDHGIVEHDVRCQISEPTDSASEQNRHQVNTEFVHDTTAQALLHHVRAGNANLLTSRQVGGTLQGRVQVPYEFKRRGLAIPPDRWPVRRGVRGASGQRLVTHWAGDRPTPLPRRRSACRR